MTNKIEQIQKVNNLSDDIIKVVTGLFYESVYCTVVLTGDIRQYQIRLRGNIFDASIFNQMKKSISLFPGVFKVDFTVSMKRDRIHLLVYENLKSVVFPEVLKSFDRINDLTAELFLNLKISNNICFKELGEVTGYSNGYLHYLLTGKRPLKYFAKRKIYAGFIQLLKKNRTKF